jgi:1-acyl-sn-glycerol-3-phosphate acyltransferase
LFVVQSAARRLSRVNQEPAGLAYRNAARGAHVFLTLAGRRDWRSQDKVPQSGGVLFVSNHISRFDPLLLADYIIWSGRYPRFLAKDSLFRLKSTGWLMRITGSVPVDRNSPRAADALGPAAEKLRAGQAVVVFPEGTESKDPEVWPMVARTGAARLALTTGVPVVPIAQWGAQRLIPPVPTVRRTWVPPRLQFACGDPIGLSDFAGLELTREVLELATTRMIDALTAMLADLRQEPAPLERWDRRVKARVPVQRELPHLPGPGDRVDTTLDG